MQASTLPAPVEPVPLAQVTVGLPPHSVVCGGVLLVTASGGAHPFLQILLICLYRQPAQVPPTFALSEGSFPFVLPPECRSLLIFLLTLNTFTSWFFGSWRNLPFFRPRPPESMTSLEEPYLSCDFGPTPLPILFGTSLKSHLPFHGYLFPQSHPGVLLQRFTSICSRNPSFRSQRQPFSPRSPQLVFLETPPTPKSFCEAPSLF